MSGVRAGGVATRRADMTLSESNGRSIYGMMVGSKRAPGRRSSVPRGPNRTTQHDWGSG